MRDNIRPRTDYDPEACPNHGPASGIDTLACAACNTYKWNGVDLCGRVIVSAVHRWNPKIRRFEPSASACTRKKGHDGKCEHYDLSGPNGTSYVPY